MFTLRYQDNRGQYPSDRFVKTLSNDKEKALKLAKSYADVASVPFVDGVGDMQLNAITKEISWTDTMVRFGKNKGTELRDCEPKFIVWVANGCVLKNEHGGWVTHCFGGPEFQKIAQQIACDMQLGVMEEENFYDNAAYSRLLERRAEKAKRDAERAALISGHHFKNGEKVTLNVKLGAEFSFKGQYGTTYIIQLIADDNRVFTYKGSTPPRFYGKATIQATIKHSTYKEQPQTLLQRIKIIE